MPAWSRACWRAIWAQSMARRVSTYDSIGRRSLGIMAESPIPTCRGSTGSSGKTPLSISYRSTHKPATCDANGAQAANGARTRFCPLPSSIILQTADNIESVGPTSRTIVAHFLTADKATTNPPVSAATVP